MGSRDGLTWQRARAIRAAFTLERVGFDLAESPGGRKPVWRKLCVSAACERRRPGESGSQGGGLATELTSAGAKRATPGGDARDVQLPALVRL